MKNSLKMIICIVASVFFIMLGIRGAFCEADKRTMRQLIACNSHVEIMNIPVENLYFECFYKIVRVK